MAILLWTAGIGFGLKEKMWVLCALGVLAPIPFWVVDAFYRHRGRGFILRFWAIRDFIRDGRYLVKAETDASLAGRCKKGSV